MRKTMKRVKNYPSTVRYAFTLIEALISFSLISILVGFLFASLYQQSACRSKVEKRSVSVMKRAKVQQTLSKIFANLSQDVENIYTKEGVLHFEFEQELIPDVNLSGLITASLYAANNALYLRMEKEKEERIEKLKEGVSHLSFRFLALEDKGVVEVAHWDREKHPKKSVPLYIKIILNESEAYAFWVSGMQGAIAIPEKDIHQQGGG